MPRSQSWTNAQAQNAHIHEITNEYMNASQFPTIAPNPNRIHLCMQTVQSTQFTAKHLYIEFLVVKWAYCAPQNKYFNCLMTKEHTVIRLHICTFNLMGFELGYYLDLCNLYRNFWNFSEQNTMQSNILGIWLFIISDMCFLEQQNVFFYSNLIYCINDNVKRLIIFRLEWLEHATWKIWKIYCFLKLPLK